MKAIFLLKCLGKALVRQVGNGVGLGGLGDALVQCGEEAWEAWRRERNAAERRAELEAVARLAVDELRDEIRAVVREVAGDKPAAIRQRIEECLSQVPDRIRQSFASPSDPTGTSLPPDRHADRPSDLTSILSRPGDDELDFHGHTGPVRAAAFHPKGHLVFSGGQDGILRIWDAGTGRILQAFPNSGSPITALVVSPDGRFVVCGSEDGGAGLWDVAQRRTRLEFPAQKGAVRGAAFSPDGRVVVVAGGGHDAEGRPVGCGLILRTADVGAEIARLATAHGPICSVAFLPDGRHVVAGGWDHTLRLWDSASRREIRTYPGHGGPVWGVAVTPDGRHALACGADRAVHVWDLASGRESGRLEGHTDWVVSVSLSPDGRRAATAGRDGTVRVWDWRAARETHRDRGHGCEVCTVAWHADALGLLSGGSDGGLRRRAVTGAAGAGPRRG